MVARVEALKKLAFTALGAPEMASEAAKRGWEATVGKANEIKQLAKEKIEAVKDAAWLLREKAVNTFLEKTAPIRQFAQEKRDQVVNKAKAVGTKTAEVVAYGAERVVATVEYGVGAAVAGANAVDSAIRWTLREAQAKPKEWKAGIHEGLAGVAREAANALRRFERRQTAKAESHRASAEAIRARYAKG